MHPLSMKAINSAQRCLFSLVSDLKHFHTECAGISLRARVDLVTIERELVLVCWAAVRRLELYISIFTAQANCEEKGFQLPGTQRL